MLFYYALNFFCALYSCTVDQPVLVESKGIDGGVQENFVLHTEPLADEVEMNVIPDNPIVWLKDGGLRGFPIETVGGRKVLAFQGIPYAQPPVGQLRFREPQRNSPWKGVRDAIAVSPTCIQVDFFQLYKLVGQEDCLYLNVYTPKIPKSGHGSSGLPVLVGIHQGGFFFGSSNLLGPAYLMDENVVLVTLNYRLGALGFLSTGDGASPGNNGLKDQNLALRWVQENIRHFGGDPNRVTLFGESAGAGSVHYHMLSPMSKGLFHSGISQSGCAFCFWSINEKPLEMANSLGSAVGCASANTYELVDCLRTVNVSTLVGSHVLQLEWSAYPVAVFTPVIESPSDGAFLDDLPENTYKKPNGVAKIPWITGVNSDEMAVNLASILLNPALVKQFNEEWESTVGPVMMELKNSSTNPAATLREIWEFYMGRDSLSFDTRKKALKMLSDRYLVTCGHKAIRYHAHFSGMPVYAYYLNFPGKYSTVQLLGQKPEDWGVAHIDDLIYLANNTAYYPTLQPNDTEYRFSKMLTSMWANFASYGIPFITEKERQLHVWQPVTQRTTTDLRFLDLNLEPKMISDPFKDRIRFWKSLDLKEGDYFDPSYDVY